MSDDQAVAWMHPTAKWAHEDRKMISVHCQKDGPQPIPLYTRPAEQAVTEATGDVEPTWLVVNGPDGQCAKVVQGFDNLKREVVATVFGDACDASDEAQDIRDRLDTPDDWEGDRWSISWSFEDGYLTVQRITAMLPLPESSAIEAVTEAGFDAAAHHITKWLGFSWDGLSDGRVTDRRFPIFTRDQFGWDFQGRTGDMPDLARVALKAAMETMSIARHEGRNQVCCDTCPAAYPNTYADEDWSVMISDAKTAGWRIRKARPDSDRDTTDLFGKPPRIAGNAHSDTFTHACPECARPQDIGGCYERRLRGGG